MVRRIMDRTNIYKKKNEMKKPCWKRGWVFGGRILLDFFAGEAIAMKFSDFAVLKNEVCKVQVSLFILLHNVTGKPLSIAAVRVLRRELC